MQLKEFKIRASSVSHIMTNPQKKTDILSKTCTSYLHEWVKEQIYGVKKEIKSKYLTKGIDVEYQAIEYYADEKELGFVLPNTEYFSNEFCQGTPDLLTGEKVYEFKSSWNCFTFPLFDTDPDKGYWMQAQIYMQLTNLKQSSLVYTLQNTPDELVWDESIDYSNIASKYRIKQFDFELDPEFIESVYDRVLLCREYIKGLDI